MDSQTSGTRTDRGCTTPARMFAQIPMRPSKTNLIHGAGAGAAFDKLQFSLLVSTPFQNQNFKIEQINRQLISWMF